MSMKEGLFLHNTHHVETDSFGAYSEQSLVVGFSNYGSEGKSHYSFDEIEEMLKNGFVDDNIGRYDSGGLYLKSYYCSYSSSFKIVCGQVLTEINEKHKAIYDYCKRIGLIKDDFVPVVGWFGTKEMTRNEDGTVNIFYTFNNFESKKFNIEFAEKICIGAIKKLAGRRRRIHGKDEIKVEKVFECKDVKFNRKNGQLTIESIPLNYAVGEIVSSIVSLDLELWMLFNDNKYWSRFFNTAIDVVRDMGQTHWFSSLKYVDTEEDKERNLSWFDRKLGDEWQ